MIIEHGIWVEFMCAPQLSSKEIKVHEWVTDLIGVLEFSCEEMHFFLLSEMFVKYDFSLE